MEDTDLDKCYVCLDTLAGRQVSIGSCNHFVHEECYLNPKFTTVCCHICRQPSVILHCRDEHGISCIPNNKRTYQSIQLKRVTQRRTLMVCKEQVHREITRNINIQINNQSNCIVNIEKTLRDQLNHQKRIHTVLVTEFGKNIKDECTTSPDTVPFKPDIHNKQRDHYISYRQRRSQSIHMEAIHKEIQTYAIAQTAVLERIQNHLRILLDIKQNITHQFATQEAVSTNRSYDSSPDNQQSLVIDNQHEDIITYMATPNHDQPPMESRYKYCHPCKNVFTLKNNQNRRNRTLLTNAYY
jgi:hypothetical protein